MLSHVCTDCVHISFHLVFLSSWHCPWQQLIVPLMWNCTVRVDSLPHRKWRDIQQQPGTAGPGNMLGCCLTFFHFLWGRLSTRTVQGIALMLSGVQAKWSRIRFLIPPLWSCMPTDNPNFTRNGWNLTVILLPQWKNVAEPPSGHGSDYPIGSIYNTLN